MTRDEILALPAGSELDRLVAEKVMGWKRSKSDQRYWWCDPGFYGDTPHSLEVSRTPKFSSEIDAAWAVTGWCLTNPPPDVDGADGRPMFQIGEATNGWWYAAWVSTFATFECRRDEEACVARAELAPHAICLAALLRAFGVA